MAEGIRERLAVVSREDQIEVVINDEISVASDASRSVSSASNQSLVVQ